MNKPPVHLLACGALSLALLLPIPASAGNVSSCGSITTNSTLIADISYTGSGTCFTLSNGADLNLNGHAIVCDAAAGLCDTAVRASDFSPTRVYNGTIVAGQNLWAVGVQDVREVDTLTVTSAVVAVAGWADRTQFVRNNTFTCTDLVPPVDVGCVDVEISTSLGYVQDNRFQASVSGIRITGRPLNTTTIGSPAPLVARNVFEWGLHKHMIEQVGSNNRIRFQNNTEMSHITNTDDPCVVDNQTLYADASFLGNACSPTDADLADTLCCR